MVKYKLRNEIWLDNLQKHECRLYYFIYQSIQHTFYGLYEYQLASVLLESRVRVQDSVGIIQ